MSKRLWNPSHPIALILLMRAVALPFGAAAQQKRDSTLSPIWLDSLNYVGGPSIGSPPSDFAYRSPPSMWCVQPSELAGGDSTQWTLGEWKKASLSWLASVLGDSGDLGQRWRKALGGAPQLSDADSIAELVDERLCREIAGIINRDLLGWQVYPPVVVFRVRELLIAYPSNVHVGEFGVIVALNLRHQIRGVGFW